MKDFAISFCVHIFNLKEFFCLILVEWWILKISFVHDGFTLLIVLNISVAIVYNCLIFIVGLFFYLTQDFTGASMVIMNKLYCSFLNWFNFFVCRRRTKMRCVTTVIRVEIDKNFHQYVSSWKINVIFLSIKII